MVELKTIVDDDLMVRFRKAIRKKEGGLKGNVSKAVSESIVLYINNVEEEYCKRRVDK